MKPVVCATPLGPVLQQFFVDHLVQQRHASPRTIAAYRDCFRLLLCFAERQIHKRPVDLSIEDLDSTLILAFLDHLEKQRGNSIRSRNARFAAIRSFMHYATHKEPATLAVSGSVLSIPMKRFERPLLGFLLRDQIEAILAACDASTWTGRRDRVMFATLYNTGARVNELITAQVEDLTLDVSAAIRLHGKGRKDRSVPLWPATAAQLRRWLREHPGGRTRPVFPNRFGARLSRTTVSERLRLAVQVASRRYPELSKRRVTPHSFRHSIAMHMLQAGVDITVIALWLGHESLSTTHSYIEADLAMKERALKSLQPPASAPIRYRPPDRLLHFLQGL